MERAELRLWCNPSFSQEAFMRRRWTNRSRVFPSSGTLRWTPIGNIRFAVVKPAGDAAGLASAGFLRTAAHCFCAGPLPCARRQMAQKNARMRNLGELQLVWYKLELVRHPAEF